MRARGERKIVSDSTKRAAAGSSIEAPAVIERILEHLGRDALRCHVLLSGAGRELAIVPCFSRPLLGGAFAIGRWLGDRVSFLHDVICERPDDHASAMLFGGGCSHFELGNWARSGRPGRRPAASAA